MSNKKTKLACMGDSITNGHGLLPHQCWTHILAESLHIDVVNYGISGDTSGGMVGRFSAMLHSENPSHVFIMGGTNDLSFGLPDNLILSNIKTMTRQARHLGIPFIIGVPSTYYPSGTAKLYDISIAEFQKRLENYQAKVKEFIRIDECPSIDFSVNLERKHFLDDGIHPNEFGQKIMASEAIKTLSAFLISS